MSNGLIHLYHGDGKGKTTAAMGLAVRALGCGRRVVIVQFLKGGATGELEPLQTLGATFYRGKAGQKFVFQMNEEEKAATRALQTENLRRALAEPADLLILDEACAAWNLNMVDRELLQNAVRHQIGIADNGGRVGVLPHELLCQEPAFLVSQTVRAESVEHGRLFFALLLHELDERVALFVGHVIFFESVQIDDLFVPQPD